MKTTKHENLDKNAVTPINSKSKRRLSQADVPGTSLTKALKIAQAIADNYGKSPTKPFHVAQAIGLSPASSYFRMLTGASIAYGLTGWIQRGFYFYYTFG